MREPASSAAAYWPSLQEARRLQIKLDAVGLLGTVNVCPLVAAVAADGAGLHRWRVHGKIWTVTDDAWPEVAVGEHVLDGKGGGRLRRQG